MAVSIDRKRLENLATLARIELDPAQEEKLLKDLQKILEHFEELSEVNTKEIAPMTGGTLLHNILRADVGQREDAKRINKLIESFPEKQGEYLKVPPVFE